MIRPCKFDSFVNIHHGDLTGLFMHYGLGVLVGTPPNGVGVLVTPKLDSNQYRDWGEPE